jgi:hypothetical protein
MIIKAFYLSEEDNIDKAIELTGLDQDEILELVGRFTKQSHRAGKVRGELIELADGTIKLRHHFTKKVIWENKC